jgi:hypothetical protein
MIYNLDEAGLSDWEDSKPKPFLIPMIRGDTMIHYPVNRQIRHQTLLYCISASGDVDCSLLVFAKQSVSRLLKWDGSAHQIAESLYVTKQLFLEYVRNAVIPLIESNRELPRYQGKLAIVFCDNCSCHCSDDTLQELANHEIILIAYPPHTSHLFQVLDVPLFGRLKSMFVHDLPLPPIVGRAIRQRSENLIPLMYN